MTDIYYMQRAYELALQGQGKTSPNPMVGAVLTKKDRIVAEGYHKRCGGPHAEIAAFNKAGQSARGAKLYVTLEPCFHFGRTAPCVDKIIAEGIKEVVVGMRDPNSLTNGKSIAKLKRAGIKVKVFRNRRGAEGALVNKLERLNEVFIKYVKEEMPFVVAKTAQTIDGKIATAGGQSKWITSSRSRNYAHKLRNNFDAILVGINTVLQDNPRLNASRKSKRIKKIILDTSLQIPLTAKLFTNTRPGDCFVATTQKANKKKLKALQSKGVNVIICPGNKEVVALPWLLKELGKREIINILFEGGAKVVGSALKEKLVDKMLIFVAPKIIGDQNALSSVRGLNAAHVEKTVKLRDINIKHIAQDLLVEGYVSY